MAITYSIKGGADAAKFNIDATTGALTFKAAPDFEKPGDANADNVYEVDVCATDAGGLYSVKPVKVTVTDVTEGSPPQITSAGAISVKENQVQVMTVTATDPDDGTAPPSGGPTGLITNFAAANRSTIKLDGVNSTVQNGNYAWSIKNPDPYTLRFEVRSGDHWPDYGGEGTNERSEISILKNYPAQTQINIDYLFTVEPGPAETSSWMLINQMHDTSEGSPPLAVYMERDKMVISLRYLAAAGGAETPLDIWRDPNMTVRGQTYHMLIKVKFDPAGNGLLDVWRDDVQIVNYRGPIGIADATYYWKQGIYRSKSPETYAAIFSKAIITTG